MKPTLFTITIAAFLAVTSTVALAKGTCLDVAVVSDADVQRNAALIASEKDLCITIDKTEENGFPWQFVVIQNEARKKGPTVFLLHDNEQAAFDTGLYSVIKYGGQLIAIEAGEDRQFRSQDPNRNFADTAAAAAPCRDMLKKPAPAFTEALWNYRNRRDNFILTLHNNANGHAGNGGGGAISAARVSSVMKGMPAPNGGDEDDAVLLAGVAPFEENAKAQDLTAYLHRNGVNVIYEHVRPERNDCSFSNYIVLNTSHLYLNIEAQHGHGVAQKQMLDVLYAYNKIKVRAIR
jgi:hypothetical protein